MKKLLALGLIVLSMQQLEAIVFIVHGTFAAKDTWYKPGGDFYKAYTDFNKTDTVASFVWSGQLSSMAHIEAAQKLCEEVIKRPFNEEKTFIGHSHGGSVINIASHLLATAQYAAQNNESLSEKLNEMMRIFTSDPYYLQEDFPYSYSRKFDDDSDDQEETRRAQEVQQQVEKELYKKLEDSVDLLSGMLLQVHDGMRFVQKKFIMHRVQLLATPILVGNYYPNMGVIRRVEHYYSQGDWIQMVGGQMKHVYPTHKRLSQIELSFAAKSTSNILVSPGHGDLHNTLMARWLAETPVIDAHIQSGKSYQLILYQDGSGYRCEEKPLEKK